MWNLDKARCGARLSLSSGDLCVKRVDLATMGTDSSSVYGSCEFKAGVHVWTVHIQNLRSLFGQSSGAIAVAFGVMPSVTKNREPSHWCGYGWDTAGFTMRGDGARHYGGFCAADGTMEIEMTFICDDESKTGTLKAQKGQELLYLQNIPLPVRPFFFLAYQSNTVSVMVHTDKTSADCNPPETSIPSSSGVLSVFAASAMVALGSGAIAASNLMLGSSLYGSFSSSQKLDDLSSIREMLQKEKKNVVHKTTPAPKALESIGFDLTEHNIAFCGLPSWGKSTCINALLRQPNPPDSSCSTAAYVNDFGEGTREIHKYAFPVEDTRLVFYDLPGMGSPRHPFETYWDTMGLASFHGILLFLNRRRLMDMETRLLRRALEEGRPIAVVYGKMDEAIRDMQDDTLQEDQDQDDEARRELVAKLRAELVKQLDRALAQGPAAVRAPAVFLISGEQWAEGRREYDEEALEKFIMVAALRGGGRCVAGDWDSDSAVDSLFEGIKRKTA